MKQEKTTLEIIAPTVDEAIERGIDQLGMSRDELHVEVLDQGSRGFFRIGGRQARVRLTIKTEGITDKYQEEVTDEEEENSLKLALNVVKDLLKKMKVSADVTGRYQQLEGQKGQPMVLIDIQGDDLSILIGRHSETLNALQYITNLIVSKQLGKWAPLMIDVRGYRARRERQLRQMAQRLAEQAIHTERRQTLEPMPANERRIVHLALKDHPKVTTESVGEDPYRKVTIFLK